MKTAHKYYSCKWYWGNLTEGIKNSTYLHSCGFSSFHNGYCFSCMYPIGPNGVSVQIADWLHFGREHEYYRQFLTNGEPFGAIWFVFQIKSVIVSHHTAQEPNSELSTHLVQTSAKTQVCFVGFSKVSLLKGSNSNSNKSLLIKPNSKYQIICPVRNCCLAFILLSYLLRDAIRGRISQERFSKGKASQP